MHIQKPLCFPSANKLKAQAHQVTGLDEFPDSAAPVREAPSSVQGKETGQALVCPYSSSSVPGTMPVRKRAFFPATEKWKHQAGNGQEIASSK